MDVGEGAVDGVDLREIVGVRDVYNMDEEIGFGDLIESGLEAFDELGREFADESDGVGEEEGEVANNDLADGGVEGGEKFVFGEDIALSQKIEEGGLADVSVADECHADK